MLIHCACIQAAAPCSPRRRHWGIGPGRESHLQEHPDNSQIEPGGRMIAPGSWNGHRCCSCAFLPSASLPLFLFHAIVCGGKWCWDDNWIPTDILRTHGNTIGFSFLFNCSTRKWICWRKHLITNWGGGRNWFFTDLLPSLCSKCFIVQTQFSLSHQWFPVSSKYSNVPNNFKSYFHRSTLRSSAAGWTLWSTPSSPTSL